MRLSRCGLVIGAVVPTAGASVFADIKTFHHLGEYAVPLITGLTIQNLSKGLQSVLPYSPQILEDQWRSIMTDFPVKVVKIGAFLTRENGEFLYSILKEHQSSLKIVYDPVFQVSVNQAPLLQQDSHYLLRKLCQISTIITPNLTELGFLIEQEISSIDDVFSNFSKLSQVAPNALWYIKGGHSHNSDRQVTDIVYYQGKYYQLKRSIRLSYTVHGTGCVLASALSAFLLEYPEDLLHCCRAAFFYLAQQYANALWIREDYPYLISHR